MAWLRTRWFRITAIILTALALAVVVLIAAFPVGPFRRIAEERLSARFGRPVTIGALERREAFSFTPTIVVRDLRVPQAEWAGTGDLARVAELSARIRALPLLMGVFSPQTIVVRGVRLDLVRDANGRRNWAKEDDRNTAGGDAPTLDNLAIEDSVVRYRDAKRDRSFVVAVVADTARGVRLSGTGIVRGAAVRLRAAGPAIGDANRPWPFTATIDGPQLSMTANGRMDTPLNTGRMTLAVTARAADLKLIDSIIEAGLFSTQPVTLSADVRHDDTRWTARNMKGTIGTSDFTGQIIVDKVDGRSKIDGDLHARRLDFDDLASEGLAKARAREAQIGPRVVPATRINIAKITRTDGRLGFRIDRIISAGRPTSLRNARGTITLDRQLLKIAPLRVGLNRGAITGTLTVDQRGAPPVPTVTIAANMTDSSIAALTGSGDISGRLDARVRLTGKGSTIRQVVARSNGTIGIVARDGALPAKMAAMLGFDAGRALTTGDDAARATLRCAIVRMAVTNGNGAFAPLLIDTSASQTRGTGAIDFPSEGLSATLTGAPKHNSLLRVPGSVTATGSLSHPRIVVPKETKSVGNILKGLGRAITGKQGPTATDANCAALSRRALGR